MLEPDGGLQPSQVVTGVRQRKSGTNQTDEDACPEEAINASNNAGAQSSTIFTPEMLAAVAGSDEVSDVLERIGSYIAIEPDLGSSFAYIDFKEGYQIDQALREKVLGDMQSHWLQVQDFMFSKAISLSVGIHTFISNWMTYGKQYVAIIREKDKGNPIDIHVQYTPFKPIQTLNSQAVLWKTDYDQTIWEKEDMFCLDWQVVDMWTISFVAGVMRTYNMWTSVERTRVANAIMAAQFRSIYTVPTSGLGKVKARQKLSSVMALYKRDIRIDNATGQTTVNGENSYPVNTEIWVSETSTGSVKIDNPGDGNVQLNSTDLPDYFMRKFYKRAKLPMSKYEAVDSGYLNGLSEIDEDERQFKLYIQKCRAALSVLFLDITWRLMAPIADYAGRTEYRKNATMVWHDEPNHETPAEQLDTLSDILDKIKGALDNYKETLEAAGFTERQQIARINVLRVKMMKKYCPELLEQTTEDYRNVPEEETPESGSGFDSSEGWSDSDSYDDMNFDSNGTDDFSDYSDSDWDSEFASDGDDWSEPETVEDDFSDFDW